MFNLGGTLATLSDLCGLSSENVKVNSKKVASSLPNVINHNGSMKRDKATVLSISSLTLAVIENYFSEKNSIYRILQSGLLLIVDQVIVYVLFAIPFDVSYLCMRVCVIWHLCMYVYI